LQKRKRLAQRFLSRLRIAYKKTFSTGTRIKRGCLGLLRWPLLFYPLNEPFGYTGKSSFLNLLAMKSHFPKLLENNFAPFLLSITTT